MEQFLAELGYISCFAFGTPTCKLEENFNGYLGLGMFLFIAGSISLLVLFIISIYFIIHKLKER